MSKIAKQFGKEMRKVRQAKEMTQLDLAQETGLDLTTINELENGHREPLLGTIKKIAQAMDVSVSSFIE